MPKRFPKHKLLFDENMAARQLFPRLNEHFDVKHVRDDLNRGGIDDPPVYDLAVGQGRIIITRNGDDFRPLRFSHQDFGPSRRGQTAPLVQAAAGRKRLRSRLRGANSRRPAISARLVRAADLRRCHS